MIQDTTNTTPPSIHPALAEFIERTEHALDSMGLHDIIRPFREAGFGAIPIEVMEAYQRARQSLEAASEDTKALLALVEGVALQGVAGKQASSVLRCSRLDLLDEGGRVRAVLGMSSAGTPRDRAMPDLGFYAENGEPIAHLGAWFDDEAQAELPALQFNGPHGTDGHAIHGYPDGALSITTDGRETWRILHTGEAQRAARGA